MIKELPYDPYGSLCLVHKHKCDMLDHEHPWTIYQPVGNNKPILYLTYCEIEDTIYIGIHK